MNTYAQQTPLPHGMVYGVKPDTGVVLEASKLEAFMGRKNRISTVIKGRVLKVTNEANGWFEIVANNGKIILARFKNDGISLPAALKGRTVIIQGIATRKMEAINGKPTGSVIADVKKPTKTKNGTVALIFELTGLMIYQ